MSLRPAKNMYDPRGHVIVTEPAIEPVSASDFRDHLRYTAADMTDDEADGWISSARAMIEEYTGLALITQSWRMVMDRWPAAQEPWWDGVREGSIAELRGAYAELRLPRYPLQTVDTVTTYDNSGASTAITVATVFDVDTYSKPGRMALKSGQTWPVALRPTNAIDIVYTSGYGANDTDVPAPLRLAVKMVAAYLENHRGDGCTAEDAMAGVMSIMSKYKVARI